MKRRSFIQTNALGLLGLSLPATFSTGRTGYVRNWMQQLMAACGIRRRFTAAAPADLQLLFNTLTAELGSLGYQAMSSAIYTDASGTFCCYPFELRHALSDTVEYLIPFFHKNTDGVWKRAAILNGYALEALSKAAEGFQQNRTASLSEILLPLGVCENQGQAVFATRRGYWHLETRLQSGLAISDITVYENSRPVFSMQFESAHCLRHTRHV